MTLKPPAEDYVLPSTLDKLRKAEEAHGEPPGPTGPEEVRGAVEEYAEKWAERYAASARHHEEAMRVDREHCEFWRRMAGALRPTVGRPLQAENVIAE